MLIEAAQELLVDIQYSDRNNGPGQRSGFADDVCLVVGASFYQILNYIEEMSACVLSFMWSGHEAKVEFRGLVGGSHSNG